MHYIKPRIKLLVKATYKVTDTKELRDRIKNSLKRSADSAMILGKMNHHLLSLRRKIIILKICRLLLLTDNDLEKVSVSSIFNFQEKKYKSH